MRMCIQRCKDKSLRTSGSGGYDAIWVGDMTL